MHILRPDFWDEYSLIDSGNYQKLEKFGKMTLMRPEPQAVWDTSMPLNDWYNQANAVFTRKGSSEDKGEWQVRRSEAEQWFLPYDSENLHLKFRLGLSAFKHVGLFPEQAVNWEFIFSKVKALEPKCRVLNLFAYTGGASLAARAAGAEVVHLDAVKQVIGWARENMEASGLDGIRWVVEDVMKFVKREERRKNYYQGIILDPPAYGRGPKGEKWILEQHLNPLLKICQALLDPEKHFFILNLYSIGFSPLIQETLIRSVFPKLKNPEMGELYLEDSFRKKLPLGSFFRFSSV